MNYFEVLYKHARGSKLGIKGLKYMTVFARGYLYSAAFE